MGSRIESVLFAALLIALSATLGQSDDEMLKHIRVPEGFVVEQVAGPPLVNRLISADFDERGRLYVTDSSGTNESAQTQLAKRPHRVVRLEDTNGDGVFDNSTVFADKMMFPEGALWHDGSLYVGAPPHIWKLTDTDDDGVADKREIWFDSKTLGGCANEMHGPYLGPDGWLYWCKGEFLEQTYERPGKEPLVTRAAHIFRRHPRGGPVEVVMTGGMNNPVDFVFTPDGERIFSTTFLSMPQGGKRDGLIHAVYGGVYPRPNGVLEGHPRTGELMPVLVHMGVAAPCGLARLESNRMGEGFQNCLLACQFNTHQVSRHVLAPSGASYISQDEAFLTSDHQDFHPTDVLEDADGSVLVLNTGGWYMLCCPTSRLHKPDVLGAIYRVRPKEFRPIEDPRGSSIAWTKLEADQAAKLLGDSRPAVRRRALEMLVSRGAAAIPALSVVTKGQSPREVRMQAVWALTRIDDNDSRAAVRAALADQDELVRQAALHGVAIWKDASAIEALEKLLGNESLHNRRAAAEALGRIGKPEAVAALLQAAGDYRGRVLDHSLVYALIEIGNAQQIRLGLAADNPHTRRAAMLALDNLPDGGLQAETVVALLDSDDAHMADAAWWITQRHPEWAAALVGLFRKYLFDTDIALENLPPLTRNLARFSESKEIQAVMAAALGDANVPRATKLAVLQAMAASRKEVAPQIWWTELSRLLNTDDQDLIAGTVSVIDAHSPSPLAAELKQVADNAELPLAVRIQALAVSAQGQPLDNGQVELVAAQLSASQPARHRSLAIDAVLGAQLTDDQLIVLTAKLSETASMDLARLITAFEKSSSDAVGEKMVLALSESPASTALDKTVVHRVLARYSPTVRQRASQLLERIEAADKEKAVKFDEILKLVQHGDVRRGQDVFFGARASCSSCHAVGYRGGKIGPDLTSVGRIRDDQSLLESILYPSSSFVQSFEPVTIVTTLGTVHSGVLREETSKEIVLSLDAEKVVRIPRDTIEETRAGSVSIMPAGLEKQLTAQQLADLLVFLRSTK